MFFFADSQIAFTYLFVFTSFPITSKVKVIEGEISESAAVHKKAAE
jgi:hypothetical protein